MAEQESLKTKTITNLAWKFAERVGAQGVSFVVSIVLARILAPEDYGVIALIMVFTALLDVFIDSGLGNALIQKKNADDLDFSTVFLFNLAMCTCLYLGMFFAAPWIADFYAKPEIVPVIRVLSLTLLISGFRIVQQAYVSKHLVFKRFFYSTLGGTIGSGVVGIAMAYLGFGVWALVAQQLFSASATTLILWMTVAWRPQCRFSFERLQGLFSYGGKLLLASLIHTFYMNVRSLVIGKWYSAADLAFFDRGQKMPQIIVSNINTSIDSVLLPVMSRCQDDRDRVRAMTRRAIMVSSFIMWPMMGILAATGETLIPLLLTEKWLPCLPFFYIFCFCWGLEPLTTANLNAIRAMGRSDIILQLEITKKTLGLLIIVCAAPFGVMAIGLSCIVYSFVAISINTRPNRKLLQYKIHEMILDMLPSFCLAAAVFVLVYLMNALPIPAILILMLQILVGIATYLLGAKFLHMEAYAFVMGTAKDFLKKIHG